MADLKVTKAALNSAVSGASPAQGPKSGPSAFDAIRSKLAEKVAADIKLPPLAQATPQQIAAMDNGVKKQLAETPARSAADFFRVDMKNARAGMEKLSDSVNRLPQSGALTTIRERLNAIEQQYQKSGALIQRTKDMDPKSLLNVQVQLYQLSENIELLSRVVDQVSSGAKTVMQTQV